MAETVNGVQAHFSSEVAQKENPADLRSFYCSCAPRQRKSEACWMFQQLGDTTVCMFLPVTSTRSHLVKGSTQAPKLKGVVRILEHEIWCVERCSESFFRKFPIIMKDFSTPWPT